MNVRMEKYGNISTEISEQLPLVPLFYNYSYTGVRKAITGLKVAVDGTIYFNDAKK
jgi:ABC-type transport system substrate-binding protein